MDENLQWVPNLCQHLRSSWDLRVTGVSKSISPCIFELGQGNEFHTNLFYSDCILILAYLWRKACPNNSDGRLKVFPKLCDSTSNVGVHRIGSK